MGQKKSKSYKALTVLLSLMLVGIIALFITTVIKDKGGDSAEEIGKDEVLSSVEEQIQNEEAMTIETKYCNLYYPKKWADNLRVEIVEDELYTVEFYGTIEGKGELPLFDVVFGGEEGYIHGTLEKMNVAFVFEETEITDEWNAEETNAYYAMQEDVNFLLGMLENEKGFVKEK